VALALEAVALTVETVALMSFREERGGDLQHSTSTLFIETLMTLILMRGLPPLLDVLRYQSTSDNRLVSIGCCYGQ
jgi:hypothetical protein